MIFDLKLDIKCEFFMTPLILHLFCTSLQLLGKQGLAI